MAWRFSKHVVSGEIDNRVKGRVTGFLELAGASGRILLDLEGNAHPDMAGSLIRFRNPDPQPGSLENFAMEQTGVAGDITASRRVKNLLVPVTDYLEMDEEARSKAYRWANCLYLEWCGRLNGRIVLEGVGFDLEWVEGPMWEITEEDVREQVERMNRAVVGFSDDVDTAMQTESAIRASEDEEEVPPAEADMDAEVARMDLLNERIQRRLNTEDPGNWDLIYEEESAKLRRERGEPEPLPLTPEEESARADWIEEINAASIEALEEAAADDWKQEEPSEHRLVIECREFALELRRSGHLPPGVSDEHPLWEIANGVLIASGKLAGALNGCVRSGEWPPDELAAPGVLVFLKKARRYLSDAMRGLDSAEEDQLATAGWRRDARDRLTRLLVATQRHILEARQSLSL